MGDRKFLVGGNWKMNGDRTSIDAITKFMNDKGVTNKAEVVVFPPAPFLTYVREHLDKQIAAGAQNCWKTDHGAFTGEYSPDMLLDVGIRWVIIGHSERQSIFRETDELVGQQTAYALLTGLCVVPCIGETKMDRDGGRTDEVLFNQLEAILNYVKNPIDWSRMAIAYEPVWAIGTGAAATPEQAQTVHKSIRVWIKNNVNPGVAKAIRIIYGGSVSPSNCKDLSKEPDIDGFLVGGVSLKPDFIDVINSATTV